jgi:adenosylmethionine-8-amino-7-oxononanoate aminotransferase
MLLNRTTGRLGYKLAKEHHSRVADGMSLVWPTYASHLKRKINTSVTYQIGNIWCQLMLSFPNNNKGIELRDYSLWLKSFPNIYGNNHLIEDFLQL